MIGQNEKAFYELCDQARAGVATTYGQFFGLSPASRSFERPLGRGVAVHEAVSVRIFDGKTPGPTVKAEVALKAAIQEPGTELTDDDTTHLRLYTAMQWRHPEDYLYHDPNESVGVSYSLTRLGAAALDGGTHEVYNVSRAQMRTRLVARIAEPSRSAFIAVAEDARAGNLHATARQSGRVETIRSAQANHLHLAMLSSLDKGGEITPVVTPITLPLVAARFSRA